jgi:hypothetical protein
MKDIKTLGPKDAIHCPTPELAKKIVELNGDYFAKFHPIASTFCYIPKPNSCGSLEWCEKNGYTIHQASEFLPGGEEEYASSYSEALKKEERIYNSKITSRLTEDQKFFRELVIGITNGYCSNPERFLDESEIILSAEALFTAVKQHEAK